MAKVDTGGKESSWRMIYGSLYACVGQTGYEILMSKMKPESETKVPALPCPCLLKWAAKLIAYYGEGTEIEFVARDTINIKTGSFGVTFAPLDFTYKQPGQKRPKKSFLEFAFCPICGNKLVKNEPANPSTN